MAVKLSDLLAMPADPTYYHVFPILPKGGRMVIGAPPKSKKSFLALNMAYDLAAGTAFLGLRNSDGDAMWPVKRPLTVLVVEQEIGKFRVKERMTQIHSYRKNAVAAENLYLASKDRACTLDTVEGTTALAAHIEPIKPDIVILDPLRKFHTRDEDSSTEMEKVMRSLDMLQDKYGFTLILIHHAAKRSEMRDPDDPESLRGSGHIFADADTVAMMSKPVKTNDNLIRVSWVLRSSENPHPLLLNFQADSYTFTRHANS